MLFYKLIQQSNNTLYNTLGKTSNYTLENNKVFNTNFYLKIFPDMSLLITIKLQAMQDAPPLQLYPASDKFLM